MKKLISVVLVMAFLAFNMVNLIKGEEAFKPSLDFTGSRFAIGYLDSESGGSYPKGSFQMPEAKLRFNLQMFPEMKATVRMNLNNSTFSSVDYMYVDYSNLFSTIAPALKDSSFNPKIRFGLLKVDIGEETWGNNMVEATTVNPSATNTGASDEGLQLFQTLAQDTVGIPLKWSLSVTNGNTTTGVDNRQAKAICAKVGVNPINELYIATSFYNSGALGSQSAAMTYAGLATPPTNATEWTRSITELDIRYDIQSGKENRLEPGSPAWSDSKAFIRLAYGQFTDNGKDTVAPITKVTDRLGNYYFLEGYYNATDKIYVAARYSFVGFNKSTVYASLNSVNANDYTRITAGAGFRLSGNTHFKAEYMSNSATVPSTAVEPKTNQVSVLLTTKY